MASLEHGNKGNVKEPSKYCNFGSVKESELQLECSSLNADLNSKHIVKDPSHQRDIFGSAAYFLLHCLFLTNEQQSLYQPDNLRIYATKDLLFERENEPLFLQVQDFIDRSGRFA